VRSSEESLYDRPGVAEAWQRASAGREQATAAATELMLDLAGIEAGSRVLDVAAGAGGQTLLAARRASPSGHVLAIDIAGGMLERAAGAAREAGLRNVAVRVMDARQLDLASGSFDAAICRSSLMLIAGWERALAEIYRVLRADGRLAAIVFSTAARNPFMALPREVVGRRLVAAGAQGVPESDLFCLGDPGVLERGLEQVGFRDVAVQPVAHARSFASLAETLDELRASSPTLLAMLDRLDAQAQESAWLEIERGFAPYAGPGGVVVPGELLVAVGAKQIDS
jgi:SAM-dependent methyltransferase